MTRNLKVNICRPSEKEGAEDISWVSRIQKTFDISLEGDGASYYTIITPNKDGSISVSCAISPGESWYVSFTRDAIGKDSERKPYLSMADTYDDPDNDDGFGKKCLYPLACMALKHPNTCQAIG